MEHLPVILKKGRPFLNDLSSPEASHRAVCPRGKLLCFLDQHYHLNIHCLYDDEQSVSVEGSTFAGYAASAPSLCVCVCVCEGGGGKD